MAVRMQIPLRRALIGIGLFLACHLGVGNASARPRQVEAAVAGRDVYLAKCASCHGEAAGWPAVLTAKNLEALARHIESIQRP